MMKNLYRTQKGEVSLFVVIFATLLLTIVTVSFVRIMLDDQQQASTIDLSQSAYDSAQAGVEDAKRAILKYMDICSTGGDCAGATLKMDSKTCNVSVGILSDIDTTDADEVKVQQGSSQNKLNQAYTCTIITLNTIDTIGELSKDGYTIIPLRAVSDFDKIKIEWFTSSDIDSPDINWTLALTNNTLLNANWPQNRPPVLRAQLIQFNQTGFILDDFDSNGIKASNSTLFLHPSSAPGFTTDTFASDSKRSSTSSPKIVSCKGYLSTGGYACSTTLQLLNNVTARSSTAFLRLGALHNDTSYRVTLYKTAIPVEASVKFDAVQPVIDSTGRTNDLFRRVEARVQLNADFEYPKAEIYVTGNFCKDFRVTNAERDYLNNSNCNL